jgi:hypothetical protein
MWVIAAVGMDRAWPWLSLCESGTHLRVRVCALACACVRLCLVLDGTMRKGRQSSAAAKPESDIQKAVRNSVAHPGIEVRYFVIWDDGYVVLEQATGSGGGGGPWRCIGEQAPSGTAIGRRARARPHRPPV